MIILEMLDKAEAINCNLHFLMSVTIYGLSFLHIRHSQFWSISLFSDWNI